MADDVTPASKAEIKRALMDAKDELPELGGLKGFTSGEWLLTLVRKAFRNYWSKANAEYFRNKYPAKDDEFIVKRLTKVAARNAGLLGAGTGAVVSTDELVAIFTGAGGGFGLPANIAIAATAIAAEGVALVRIHLQLIANIAKLVGAPLDPEDPEDILTILAFALGGAAAEGVGKFGAKVGGRMAGAATKRVLSGETLKALKALALKLHFRILQRSVVKYAVPIASMGVGAAWNYAATRAVGKIAYRNCLGRLRDMGPVPNPSSGGPVPASISGQSAQ